MLCTLMELSTPSSNTEANLGKAYYKHFDCQQMYNIKEKRKATLYESDNNNDNKDISFGSFGILKHYSAYLITP